MTDENHTDFGTVPDEDNEEDVIEAGSSNVEMNFQEDDEGIPEHQEVDPDVQEALDNAVEQGSGVEYDSHRDAIDASTGNTGEDEHYEPNKEPQPEDYMMSEEEAEEYAEENVQTDEVEDLPDTSAEDIGMEDGETDFSALKSTEEVTETVTRGDQEFEFVFKEPEDSDDEIINMIRDKRDNRNEEIDEAKLQAEIRREAVMKTIVNYPPEVIEREWDDFAGSVRLQLGGRALDVLGLMDFIQASGVGPGVQQGE